MIATAIPAGFAAGLFGIGGGLVTVPILFYIFSFSGIETAYVMHLAVGTSFGIIIPTSTVSVLTHHQHKAVDFNIVKGFGFFVATGVILGTIFAASLETKPLILFFTIPLLDFLIILEGRFKRGVSPTIGGTDHISHRLLAKGLSEKKVLLVFIIYSIFNFSIILGYVFLSNIFSIIALLIYLVQFIFLFNYLRKLNILR